MGTCSQQISETAYQHFALPLQVLAYLGRKSIKIFSNGFREKILQLKWPLRQLVSFRVLYPDSHIKLDEYKMFITYIRRHTSDIAKEQSDINHNHHITITSMQISLNSAKEKVFKTQICYFLLLSNQRFQLKAVLRCIFLNYLTKTLVSKHLKNFLLIHFPPPATSYF